MKSALRVMVLATAALPGAVLATGCNKGPTRPSSAQLTITVTPQPVVVQWACPAVPPGGPPPPQCFLSMDPTVTITESAGVGGRVETLTLRLRDLGTGSEQAIVYGRDWLIANVGTDRIAGNANLAFRIVVVGYPLPFANRPNVSLIIDARFVDDEGNLHNPTVRLDIT